MEQLEFVFSIITTVVAVYVALVAYRLNRKSNNNQTFLASVQQWQALNNAILTSQELREIEVENHPFGEVDEKDVQRMYLYFCRLNVARTSYESLMSGLADEQICNGHINNVANLLKGDRDFVRNHCFPRGYPKISKELEKRWALIDDRDGLPLPMDEVVTRAPELPWYSRLL